ncbi:MAG: polymer-forming cytoskeletal protein [Candidatus Neomarinimicrobiota bacterium]
MVKESNVQTNTIVGPNTDIRGNLDVKGSVLVYGSIIGDIRSDGVVRSAKDSFIKGAIVAQEAVIDGELEGNLTIKGRATLGSSSKVVGEVRVDLLVIEEGAQFSGKCKMKRARISDESRRKDGRAVPIGSDNQQTETSDKSAPPVAEGT